MIQRPTLARIDLGALSRNFQKARTYIGDDQLFMAIVKADAYGHGSVECAKILEKEGIDWFGVALVEEGVELRRNGIRKPILCLGSFYPGQEELLVEYDLTPVIYDIERARELDRFASDIGKKLNVHLKIDTGMGRVGVPYSVAREFFQSFSELKHLNVTGIATHFSAADSEDPSFTDLQMERFESLVGMAAEFGVVSPILHLANTPGALSHQNSRKGLVRLGGLLYGLVEDTVFSLEGLPEFEEVMSLTSTISFLKTVGKGEDLGYGRTFTTKRESRIATVPIGYADGFPRLVSNKAFVLIDDQVANVCGRVSMDWTIIDVTDIAGVSVGDEVTLIGRTASHSISAADLARNAETISYEITCGIGSRVPRVYD